MFVRLIVAVMLVVAAAARAQAEDPVLRRVLEEAGAATPELAQARARVRAEQARIPQAGALPDPTLALAIQNDGFDAITIGTAETSFVSFMLTHPLPWFGERGLREDVA